MKRHAAQGRATIRDVAKVAGVSLGTVSRVINGSDNVKKDNVDAVLQAIEKLSFSPNSLAQSIRTGTTNTVGMLVNGIANSNFSNPVMELQRILHLHGYSLLLACHRGDKIKEMELVDAFFRKQVDGLIINASDDCVSYISEKLNHRHLPIVMFDQDSSQQLDSVCIDHYSSIMDAVERLTKLGHKEIALVTPEPFNYPSRTRVSGFMDSLRRNKVEFHSRMIWNSTFDGSNTYKDIKYHLEKGELPTAIVLGGSEMLPGALIALNEKNICVPNQISLVATGDSDLSSLISPPIDVTLWDSVDVAGKLADLLIQRMRGDISDEPDHIVYPAQYIVRASTQAVGNTVDRFTDV